MTFGTDKAGLMPTMRAYMLLVPTSTLDARRPRRVTGIYIYARQLLPIWSYDFPLRNDNNIVYGTVVVVTKRARQSYHNIL